ncbi:MAG: conjugative transfer signal peptidase TraF [Sterolibacteriaceae bacterium]|uniref:Conjugative transfer signal peptidase TraF n=1 Tax=Candidatus Methylophosphatis roskildensis TaxID=2899263 RepID=A0A9D7HKM4_9PROT|nr:conjugative transfer signal peptidase TraF [Candidatus Methylophosphatis roskildensis]
MSACVSDPTRRPLRSWGLGALRRAVVALVSDRKLWLPLGAVLGIWMLAYVRVFVDPTPRLPLLFNWTDSLPYHVAWLDRDAARLERGDFVLYTFSGKAQVDYPGLRRQPFFKIVAGVPGDPIRVADRNVFVGGTYVGFAKLRTFDGRGLNPVESAFVPEGHYYVRGISPDSFDSRYQEAGLVAPAEVIGKVRPWF